MEKKYDILIVGGGPAGISAGIYAKRAGRDVVILEKFMPGGQLGLIGQIENYAGFKSIDGNELAMNFFSHAQSLNIPFIMEEAKEFAKVDDLYKITTQGQILFAKAIILALGSHSKELNIQGEKEYKGKGVSYCALCDGNFFKGKDVAVIGSGDSAFSDVEYLSNICNKVYLLTKDYLKVKNYAGDEFSDKTNVEVLKGAISQKISGGMTVESLEFLQDGILKQVNVDGVFVAIGRSPDTKALQGFVEMNEGGFVKTDDKMKTSLDGVYACGDLREGSLRQIATAVGDGAIAGTEASKYVLLYNYKHKNDK